MDSIQLGLSRRIQRDYPTDLWANHDLGLMLVNRGRPAEAVRYYTAAIALRPDNAGIYLNRGNAFCDAGEMDAAIADYSRALALAPFYASAQSGLGNALRGQGKVDEAIACHEKAIALDSKFPHAHNNLGVALMDKGKVDEAIACFQEAVRLNKDYPEAHCNLGHALVDKGKVDEAIACFRQAVALNPEYAYAHYNLGDALLGKGQVEEAIACLRQSIGLNPKLYLAHYDLGNAVRGQGKVDEAITEYRETIRLKTDYAEAHCNLGLVLEQKGQYREAIGELRRGHEFGSRNPRWAYPSAQWVRQCERLVELDEKLPGILEGKATPASPDERIELAGLCSLMRLNRAAVRFYEEAFAVKPALAVGPAAFHRYNAACAAALAGCGQGKDADRLTGMERGRMRRQALNWLRADLDDWRRLLDKKPDGIRAVILGQMRHSLEDIDFACVRGLEALAKLPEAERKPWQELWDDVANTLARAQANATPEKKSAAK